MISASETLSTIERAGRELRNDEDRLGAIIENAAAETARLRGEQSELFRALARIRLDTLQQQPVIGRIDDAERRALAAIEEQKQRLEALARRRQALRLEIEQAQDDNTARAAAVSRAAEAVAALEEATERRLADDVEWQAQAAAVTGAEARADAAEEKAQQAEADRDEKSKPYLADRLFVYLWDRGYGTAEYRGGRFARMGDSFVAKVVDYEPARRNYFSLTEIPRRLREHAERLKGEVAAEQEKLESLERAALEADGIGALEAALQAAESDLAEAEKQLAGLEAEDRSVELDRERLLGVEGEHGLMGALEELAASLQRDDLRQLMRAAMQTPTEDDERIVRRLQEIEMTIERWDQEAKQARDASIELARKRAELERSRDAFRDAGYHRRGGGFSNDKLIGDIIGGIIGGVLSSGELRDALRSGYRPSGKRSSRSGGSIFGGSSRGSSGRRGSGGFRTGGRF